MLRPLYVEAKPPPHRIQTFDRATQTQMPATALNWEMMPLTYEYAAFTAMANRSLNK